MTPREPVFINVRKLHVATCPEHKVAWEVGTNLFTTYWRWDDEELVAVFGHSDRDRVTDEAIRELEEYTPVEPARPARKALYPFPMGSDDPYEYGDALMDTGRTDR